MEDDFEMWIASMIVGYAVLTGIGKFIKKVCGPLLLRGMSLL